MVDKDSYGSTSLFYECFYESVIFGGGAGAKAVRRTHETMEKPYEGLFFKECLEVGSGNGEHLDFVRHDFKNFTLVDLRKPELTNKWSLDNRIQAIAANAESLPFQDGHFDRVISTCLLHHVEKPESVLTELNRVLGDDGVGTILLSCDPGLAVRTVRRLTVARSSRKKGFEGYELMIAREHRNHVNSLLVMSKYAFRKREIKIKYYPFGIRSWNLNGYIVITVGKILTD
jgi:phosphatidylethanolamine/phosphatidyl-N-methylethanolamine N-methyltransferase